MIAPNFLSPATVVIVHNTNSILPHPLNQDRILTRQVEFLHRHRG